MSYRNKADHAAYMRRWRWGRVLTEEQKIKDRCRSYANVYKQRGKLKPMSCWCGEAKVEMHHADYRKPLDVQWLCRAHHLELHHA